MNESAITLAMNETREQATAVTAVRVIRFVSIPTLVSLSFLVVGCTYTSQYVAPLDGRPRAVWADNHVVLDPAGAAISPGCAALLAWVSPSNDLHLIDGDDLIGVDPAPFVQLAVDLELDVATGRRFWVPRPTTRPLAARGRPTLAYHSLTPPTIAPPAAHSGVPVRSSGGGHAMGSASGTNVSGGAFNPSSLLAVLLIVAGITVVALPAVTFGLANSRPENSRANAEAIDQVNALNDWLRMPGSACALGNAS